MTITDVLMVLATLVSPFLAVYAQKKIERWRSAQDTKLWIFKTLMSSRAAAVSPLHVQALNMIDLEFSDTQQEEREVKRIWREYLDHLGSLPLDEKAKNAVLSAWQTRNQDYLADLLVAMGRCFGYKFDRVYIKKGIYAPEGHARDEMEQRAVRILLLEVLNGRRSISTNTSLVPADPAAAEFGKKFQSGLLGVFEGKQPILIKPTQ